MKIHCVTLFIILCCLLVSTKSYTQTVLEAKDSLGLKVYTIRKGESVQVLYDSAFILNKRTYKLYKDIYSKAGKASLQFQRLSDAYTDLVQKQEKLIATKDQYYNALKLSFDSLANKTSSFLDKESIGLKDIDTNVRKANADLDSIKTSLNQAIDKLKGQRKQKAQLVIGGFAIGVVVTSLIFVVAK